MMAARQTFLGRGGKSLPYDAEVEWVGSNSTLPYIDLDGATWIGDAVPWDFDLGFQMIAVSPTSTSMSSGDVTAPFCFSYGPGRRYGVWRQNNTSTQFRAGPCFRSSTVTYVEFPMDTAYHEVSVRCTEPLVRVDDTSVSWSGVESSNYGPVNTYYNGLYLFARVNPTSAATSIYPSLANVMYLRLWDKLGNLLRDMIPVRVGLEGFMYDRVSSRLFGAVQGTTLSVGPDGKGVRT